MSSSSSVSPKHKTSMAGSTSDSTHISATDSIRPKPSDQPQCSDCSASKSPPSEPMSTSQTSGQDDVAPNDLLATYDSYSTKCLRLYIAALNGDVNEAIDLADTDPSLLGKAIRKRRQTVLHVATGAKQIKFVKEMVNLLGRKVAARDLQHILELQDIRGNNAFCYAAAAGTVPIAEILLGKNRNLLEIRGCDNSTPLNIAALFGQRDIALFLKGKIDKLKNDERRDILEREDRKNILFLCIHNGWYDLALEMLDDDRSLAVARDKYHMTALHLLAKIPSAFTRDNTESILKILNSLIPAGMRSATLKSNSSIQARQLVKDLWKEILRQEYLTVEDFIKRPANLLFDAARLGNTMFLAELFRSYPCLVYERDEARRSIFHVAIMHRHTATFNLIYNLGLDKQLIATFLDGAGNNLLHLAATYLSAEEGRAASKVQGAALEMQQELIIFKEVELLIMPTHKEMKNLAGDTPRTLFTKEHARLLESGQKWMKQTATSCSVVATLIATGVFAAAFSPPGGDGNLNLKRTAFHFFAMADAVALASSSISILMFLSILTSRYAEKDFLWSLPLKLVFGIATLFISIVTMMLAFGSSFFLTYDQHRFRVFPIMITALVCLSVPVFVLSNFRLFVDILYSSFRFRFYIKSGSSNSLWEKKVEEGLLPRSDGGSPDIELEAITRS